MVVLPLTPSIASKVLKMFKFKFSVRTQKWI